MKSPKQIAQENIKRLMHRDQYTEKEVADAIGKTKQYINALLKNPLGVTDETAKTIADAMHWDHSEIYRDIDTIGKAKDANEILYDLITQLSKEDKKTVARLMIRLLNRPKEAIVVIKQVINQIDRM